MNSKTKILIFLLFSIVSIKSYSQYNWIKINLPDSLNLYTVYFHNDSIFFGTQYGIFVSEENFQSLSQIGLETKSVRQIIFTSNGELSAFTSLGEVCKYQGNNNWSIYQGTGLKATCVYESSSGGLFHGAWGYIFRSYDYGITWDTVWSSSNSEVVNDIEENATGVLFTGTRSYSSSSPGGVYSSFNNGNSWNLVGLESYGITSIELNLSNNLYAGVYSESTGGVYKSLDSLGTTWDNVYNENRLINDLKINQFNTIIIGCTMEGFPGGVYCSYDNGINWLDISGDLISRHINKIFISPNNHIYVLNSNSNSLFKLSDPITRYEEKEEESKLRIYPNPIDNKLAFSIPVSIQCDIFIYNTYGKEIINLKKGIKRGIEEVIYIPDLPQGIYILNITGDCISYSAKFYKL